MYAHVVSLPDPAVRSESDASSHVHACSALCQDARCQLCCSSFVHLPASWAQSLHGYAVHTQVSSVCLHGLAGLGPDATGAQLLMMRLLHFKGDMGGAYNTRLAPRVMATMLPQLGQTLQGVQVELLYTYAGPVHRRKVLLCRLD